MNRAIAMTDVVTGEIKVLAGPKADKFFEDPEAMTPHEFWRLYDYMQGDGRGTE